jgi:hypothetical protein
VALLGLACGSGDNPADPNVDANVAGIWNWFIVDVSSSCGPELGWLGIPVTITQTGTSVTASSLWGSDVGGPYVFDGSVSGNTLTIDVTGYPEDGGTTTATHTVVLQTDGTMFGTENWEWTNPAVLPPDPNTCTGGVGTITALPQP